MYSKYAAKACERCGKLHTCMGTPRCPCFDVVMPGSILDYIASNFDECVCIDCMEELKGKD